jgi:hypothetical protein
MSHDATNWAIKQRGLKPATKLLLWQLADRHNKDTKRCDPSQEGLADDTEMSRASVNRHLDALERRCLIRRVAGIDPRTKRQQRTAYILGCDTDLSVPDLSSDAVSQNATRDDAGAVSQNETRAVSQKTPEPCLKNGDSRVSNCDTNLVREPVIQPDAPAAAGGGVLDFDDFWNAFPNRVDRKFAEAAWDVALDAGADASTIIAAARSYAGSEVVKRGFPKKPQNWLAAENWHDAATPAVAKSLPEVPTAVADIISGNPARCRSISATKAREFIAAALVTQSQCQAVGVL